MIISNFLLKIMLNVEKIKPNYHDKKNMFLRKNLHEKAEKH